MKNQTKNIFAQALEKMLETKSLDKIHVTDICKKCDTIPQTFYYHFHDKYELVAWIFLNDFRAIYLQSSVTYSQKTIQDNLDQMNQRRHFYQKVFQDVSQNSIDRYSQKFNVMIAIEATNYVFGDEFIDDNKLMNIKYHSYGMMGLFKEWINDDQFSIEQLASFQYQHTPEFLQKAFAQYPFEKSPLLKKLDL